MTAGKLPSGTHGGDSNAICTPDIAWRLHATGLRFLLRYLSRTSPQHSGDISGIERSNILGAGLAVGYVQHYPGNGWLPSAARGQAYGVAAAINLKAIGASSGVTVWRDWEGCVTCPAAECIADMNAWSSQVKSAGFLPGIYVGYNAILDANDLYWRLICQSYWKGASKCPTPVIRGWQMVQTLAPSPVDGYDFDRDVVLMDGLGDLPSFDLPAGS